MKFSRRKFLSDSVKTVSALGILNTGFRESIYTPVHSKGLLGINYRGALAIMQGLTTSSTAEFIVATESSKHYGYQVQDSQGSILPVQITRRETRKTSPWGIEKFFVGQLRLGENYTLNVIDPTTGNIIDERFFTALNTESTKGRYVVASCMKDNQDLFKEVMWDAVNEAQPQMVFLIGDTCYADNDNDGSDADYWRRYMETRTQLSHFRQKKLIPTLATWDDHDFGGNNFDSTWRGKEMTRELFEIFWRHEVPCPLLQSGPGVAQIFSAFGQKFCMMDDRTWRSPRTEKTNPVQWGQAQEDFLFENISANNNPAILMNGSQFFGGYLEKDAFEYWQGKNLNAICQQLAKIESPVVFVGGDVHFSEFMNIEPEILGYPTIEITSSCIHSTTFPFNHLRKKNKRRINAVNSKNFVVIDSEIKSPGTLDLRAQSVGQGSLVLMDSQFTIRR